MTVTSVEKELDNATMTIISDHEVPVRRLWDAYLDPRQIEGFWGPPTWPAVFFRHDGFVGGISAYRMTGPTGDVSAGQWDWTGFEEGASFEVTDSFCHPDGTVDDSLPSIRMRFQFEPTSQGSRLVNTSYYGNPDELRQVLEMGMEEGATSAMAQIDQVLADDSFAAGPPAAVDVLDSTRLRVTRVVAAPIDEVRAAADPAVVLGWLSDVAGLPQTVSEPSLTLTSLADGTLVSTVLEFADEASRDAALGLGIAERQEQSVAQLEGQLRG